MLQKSLDCIKIRGSQKFDLDPDKNLPDLQLCIVLTLCPFLPGEPTCDQMVTVHIKVGERAAVRVQRVTHRQTLRIPDVIIML